MHSILMLFPDNIQESFYTPVPVKLLSMGLYWVVIYKIKNYIFGKYRHTSTDHLKAYTIVPHTCPWLNFAVAELAFPQYTADQLTTDEI